MSLCVLRVKANIGGKAMLIVKLEANSNGTRANQQLDFPLRTIPEGYAVIPENLEDEAKRYLPWLEIETNAEGKVVAVSENTAAKETFLEELAKQEVAEAEEKEKTEGENSDE